MKAIVLSLLALMFTTAPGTKSVYNFTMKNIDGKDVPLSEYKGKVLLIVNVASLCGNTPQYKDLQAMYKKYNSHGLEILGFPANNFMGQEPGSDKEIKEFCTKEYAVTFPMFSKISVKGKDMHPLYKFLTQKAENGVVDADVKWNFQKFLISKKGVMIGSFSPSAKVNDNAVMEAVEAALSE